MMRPAAKIHPSVADVVDEVCRSAKEVKYGQGQRRHTKLLSTDGMSGLSLNFVKPLDVPPWMTDKKVLPADRHMARIESFVNLVEMANELSGISVGYLTEPLKQLVEGVMGSDYIAYYDTKGTQRNIWLCTKELIVLIHADELRR